jgi:hypothetical protein
VREQKSQLESWLFYCPKAGEELLLRGLCGGSRRGSRGGGSSSTSGSGGSSSAGSGSSSSVSGLRSLGGGLRRFNLGRLDGLRSFGLATSGHSQCEEGGYEERLFHFGRILKVMESIYGINWPIGLIATFPFRSALKLITPGIFCGAAQQLIVLQTCGHNPVVLIRKQG